MIKTLSYKTNQFFFVLIKLSIIAFAFYYIYNRLTHNADLNFSVFVNFLIENDVFSLKNVIFLLFLTVFNWFFEIMKWKALVSSIKNITFKKALEQSLGSLTASLFTPNRIGEYGAKAMYFSSVYKKRIVLLNLLGNIAQMSITLLLGVIGLIYFTSYNTVEINYFKLSSFVLIALLLLSLIPIGLKKLPITIKGVSIEKIILFIKNVSPRIHTYSFGFSLVRYFIFSFQFYYLLLLFGVNISYLDAMAVITSMYLLASIMPSIFIFDVVIKGGIAVYLFSLIGVNEFTVLSVVTLMWLINFVLPSIFGSLYVLNFNLPDED